MLSGEQAAVWIERCATAVGKMGDGSGLTVDAWRQQYFVLSAVRRAAEHDAFFTGVSAQHFPGNK